MWEVPESWRYPYLAGWFVIENPLNVDDLGVPLF
jgi:hypothetical protein